MKKLAYEARHYLIDRARILSETANFVRRNPNYSLDETSFPARLEAINKEYREQFLA